MPPRVMQPKAPSIIEAAASGQAISQALPADQQAGSNEIPAAPEHTGRKPQAEGKMTSGAKFTDW